MDFSYFTSYLFSFFRTSFSPTFSSTNTLFCFLPSFSSFLYNVLVCVCSLRGWTSVCGTGFNVQHTNFSSITQPYHACFESFFDQGQKNRHTIHVVFYFLMSDSWFWLPKVLLTMVIEQLNTRITPGCKMQQRCFSLFSLIRILLLGLLFFIWILYFLLFVWFAC